MILMLEFLHTGIWQVFARGQALFSDPLRVTPSQLAASSRKRGPGVHVLNALARALFQQNFERLSGVKTCTLQIVLRVAYVDTTAPASIPNDPSHEDVEQAD